MAKRNGEMTKLQAFTIPSGMHGEVPPVYRVSLQDRRELRKDPTVAFARAIIMSVMLRGEWAVEADDGVADDVLRFIREEIRPWRAVIMEPAVGFGYVDYGWQGFELVWGRPDATGLTHLAKVKPLLHDLTQAVLDEYGNFGGYVQRGLDGFDVVVPPEKCLHIRFNHEGDDPYGKALLENVMATNAQWKAANGAASRYDEKVAGAFLKCEYDDGRNVFEGVEMDNHLIAKQLLNSFQSSGGIVLPRTRTATGTETVFDFSLMEDAGGKQPMFVDRLRYLDTRILRGMFLPERAATEGQFGTKAEAETHGDVMEAILSRVETGITTAVNEQVTDPLVVHNFGSHLRGKVRLVPSVTDPHRRQILQAVYQAVLASPAHGIEEIDRIDTDAIKDGLGVPKREQIDA